MELPIHNFQLYKTLVHILQFIAILAIWILCITIFGVSDRVIDGRLGWCFALCFLSLFALIYLTMTPRFPRTRRFADPMIMAATDALFCLFWLSAFAAIASWQVDSDGICWDACVRAKVIVGVGVGVWLLFALTTAMSVYAVVFHSRHGYLPGLHPSTVKPSPSATVPTTIDPDKEAFSMGGLDSQDTYAPLHGHDNGQRHVDSQFYDGMSVCRPPSYASRIQGPAYAGGMEATVEADEGDQKLPHRNANHAYEG